MSARGHGKHVESGVEARELVLGERSQEVDSAGDTKRVSPAAQLTLEGPGPGAAQSQAIVTCHGLEQHGHALGSGQTADVAHLDQLRNSVPRRGGTEHRRIDSKRYDARYPGEPLASHDLARLAVAHTDACRVTEGPSLEPPEWDWVALLEVLRGVERVGGALPPKQSDEQDLGGGEGKGLFVHIDDVPLTVERSPHRPRVVDEERGVSAPGANAADPLTRARS